MRPAITAAALLLSTSAGAHDACHYTWNVYFHGNYNRLLICPEGQIGVVRGSELVCQDRHPPPWHDQVDPPVPTPTEGWTCEPFEGGHCQSNGLPVICLPCEP